MEVFLNGTKIPTEAATLSQLIEQQRIPVADTPDALLICPRSHEQHIKQVLEDLTPLEEGCEITVIRATQGG